MKEGVIPSENFTRLQAQFGDECLSQPRVFSWPKSFREGRDPVEKEPHAQRPRTSVNPDNVLKTGALIRANRRITILELSQELGISAGSVEEILYDFVVTRLLTTEHSVRRLVAVTQLLNNKRGAKFLDSVVTCDETWVHYFTPESKEQYYSTLLNEKVKPAIRSKRRKRQDSVCFLLDNGRSHTAALTMATLRKLKRDVLPHPA
ncbi:hypothetical protein Cfor_00473, partial [Coptotermes formosanus]